MSKQTFQEINTDLILGAAIAAYRINSNEYVKEERPRIFDEKVERLVPNPNFKRKNKTLVLEAISNSELITDTDRALVPELKKFIEHNLTFKLLKYDTLGDFENKMLTLVGNDLVLVSSNELAIFAYMPEYYSRETAQKQIQDRLSDTDRDFIATPGEKVTTIVDIISKKYSEKYSCHFITAISDDNKRILFAYSGKTSIDVNKKYSITATVKRNDKDFTTVLSRVKPTEYLTTIPTCATI
jgi:hypothetical protein